MLPGDFIGMKLTGENYHYYFRFIRKVSSGILKISQFQKIILTYFDIDWGAFGGSKTYFFYSRQID